MNFEDIDGENDLDYAKLNAAQNRKNKKAGGWQAMGLDQPIFKAIVRIGYKQPTQIQRKSIPLILDGRDVVGMSRTGSGKTAAFVVPMLQKLKKRDPCGFRALLLSPTRELALQTFKVVKELGKFTGLRCVCLVGGDNMDEQFSALHENPDVILATPGRLLHIVVEMNLKLSSIQYLVFDEADRLFEMGFAEQLQDILKRVPDSRQTLLFSATLPKMLVEFAKAGLSNPTLVRLDLDTKISEKLEMNFVSCRTNDKISALLFLSRWAVREQKQTIIFCATMKHVEYVATILREAQLDCTFLYSQLDPVARKQNIARFRDHQCYLLLVTDIAARGVDIPLLDVAINFHFPATSKLFVHRVGRVARAGRPGMSVSLVTLDELPYLLDLTLFLNKQLKILQENDECSKNSSDEIMLGRFPENLAHLETEFLRSIKEISTDISDLSHKSENAMKKYERTRSQPSLESIRRVKNECRTITPMIHPFFENFLDHKEADEKALLNGISNWRPNATIFEVKSNTNQHSALVMRSKRKEHQSFIDNKRKKMEKISNEDTQIDENKTSQGVDLADHKEVVEAFDQVVTISSFDASAPLQNLKKQSRKRSYFERKEQEKREHFISYLPPDAHRESALAVSSNQSGNFDKEARQVAIDICADDTEGMYRDQKRKVWDRKRKKFVSTDDPKAKKIRTEEGTWVPATYKSGRYENWKKQQKLNYRREGGESDDDTQSKPQRGRTFRNKGKFKGQNGVKNELKNRDQIIKGRKQKARLQEYQVHRRKENMKKRGQKGSKGNGGAKSKSGGSGGDRSKRKILKNNAKGNYKGSSRGRR